MAIDKEHEIDMSIQGWGTQKEYFAPKSLSRHYFEWTLHLRNNLFGKKKSLNIHILFD